MQVRRFQNVVVFRDFALPLLLKHEAHTCVIHGLIARFTDPALIRPDARFPFLTAVAGDEGNAILAATITTRRPIVISPGPREASNLLAEYLARSEVSPAGVVGAEDSSENFSAAWSECTGSIARPDLTLGLYQVERVTQPRMAAGSFRPAAADDIPVLSRFAMNFFRDVNDPENDVNEAVTRGISERRLFVWCDEGGGVVSMAAWAGPTPNGVRINFVYTPPEMRGRGYASNCVAALTRRLLDSGRRFVFLFTDMANPISNRIYQAIGYRHLGNQRKFLFDQPSPLR